MAKDNFKVSKVNLDEITFDDKNANEGTKAGGQLLKESVETLGFGRSVLVDKNGKLIAGNKTTEAALNFGTSKAIVIETDGSELVVVKRTDLDLDEGFKARALALADNQIASANLKWNTTNVELHFDAAIKIGIPNLVFKPVEISGSQIPKDESNKIGFTFKIEIEFPDEAAQAEAFNTLTEMGFDCKILNI